jgi:hypothetical protein
LGIKGLVVVVVVEIENDPFNDWENDSFNILIIDPLLQY